jgi:hypothetical protein
MVYITQVLIFPKELSKKAGYGIYNLGRNINISKRLPHLQNILKAELTTIHHTLEIITNQFPDEVTHIFTNNQNLLYILMIHIKHP